MAEKKDDFTFEISLSVLNHLGRNLYRSFVTVLGEAISNAWDADAKNVWIYIDRDANSFFIKDDGDGMTSSEFQKKFLTVGYSKRKDGGLASKKGRPFIGAKGIGKLALLSCAEKISVITKTADSEYTGGVIDNSGLDEAIEYELTPDEYKLEDYDIGAFGSHIRGHEKGTIIFFDQIKESIKNTVPYLRKLIALHFRFSLIDENFNIYVNDEKITFKDIKELADATQFLWNINGLKDDYIDRYLSNLKEQTTVNFSETTVKGFVASVTKPRYLKISDTDEKAGIDLFVNGRLRERDILKHLPDFSTRYVASYLYGQIHFDELDKEVTDKVFTSSREGVVSDNEPYKELLKLFKEKILEHISNEWDTWRLKHDEVGDEDNPQKGKKERYARNLFKESASDYSGVKNEKVQTWIKQLRDDAEFNIPSYTDCFLSENLIRKYIPVAGIPISKEARKLLDEEYKPKEERAKKKGNISIGLRQNDDDLSYLSMDDLAYMADKKDPLKEACLARDANEYKPIRDALMHTALLTAEAKNRLSGVYKNIEARVQKLLTDIS